MHSGLDIAVYGDSPSTILNDLSIAVDAVGGRSMLRAQDANINTTELGKQAKGVRDILANHHTILSIHNQAMINVNRSALL